MVACVNTPMARAGPRQLTGVARKPQAAAIRTKILHRELIATGFARSVGRGGNVRPRDGADV